MTYACFVFRSRNFTPGKMTKPAAESKAETVVSKRAYVCALVKLRALFHFSNKS